MRSNTVIGIISIIVSIISNGRVRNRETSDERSRNDDVATFARQVSLGDYLVQDESYAVSGMKQLVSLTRLLQRHARPLISVRYNGVWLSSGDDDVLHVCRGPIVGASLIVVPFFLNSEFIRNIIVFVGKR